MLVGIISDTHDNLVGLQKAIQVLKGQNIEMLIHCGDWVSPFTLEYFDRQMKDLKIPIKSVVGNNPGDTKRAMMGNSKMQNPIEWAKTVMLVLDIDGKKTVVYHGDDREILSTLIESQKYDIVLTGHTHAVRNEVIGKTLVINPGNTCYACEGEITDKVSVAVYDSKTNKAEVIYF